MDRLESFVISSFIAVLVPVCLFVAAWWLSVGIVPEMWIPVCALSVIAGAAAFSSFLALRERTIGAELEHMFGLKFTVTRSMIVAIVAIGWPVIVLAQYWCTTKAAVIAYGTHEDIEQRCR